MIVEYATQAIVDLRHIEEYYANRAGPEIAQGLVERVTGTLERLLVRNPRVGRARPHLGEDVRAFPVLPYIIFYRVLDRRVYVIRIVHGHRDIRPPLASLLVAV